MTHFRGGDWGDPETHEGFRIIVDAVGPDIVFENEDIEYSCTFDSRLRNALFGQDALPYVVLNIRVRETWTIDNGEYEGFIELLTVDKVYDYVNLYEGIHSEGSFVAQGVINNQAIKLSGSSFMEGFNVVREGTVMGWATP